MDVSAGFDGSSVLVVGGAGFVGSNLVRLLLAESTADITVVDNLLSSERENLPDDPRLVFHEASITSNDLLANLHPDAFDTVFHLATYHGNQSSIANPLEDHENNTLTTLKLLEHFHQSATLRRLVYSSAGCSVAKKTFEESKATGEEAPISLVQDSPYSLSKIFGEFYCSYYFRQFGVPAVRARFQNVYGPGEVLGAGRWRGTPATVWRNVTPTFIFRALLGKPLPLENEGVATRDFIYVGDICRGLVACALSGEPGEVYNIATGRETSIRELAETINRLAGNVAGIELKPRRSWDHSGRRHGATGKAKDKLGFEATVGLEEGLARTVEWTRARWQFIRDTMAKHREHCEIDV